MAIPSNSNPFYHYMGMALLVIFLGTITSINASNEPDMTYVGLPEDIPSPGGYCMDGSMAGYYIRPGNDPSLFVIYLKGGGGCSTEAKCLARNGTKLGSSLLWEPSILGDRLLDGNCNKNPDFCDGTAVHVPYCTSDAHMGNNTELSDDTWGLYFDGHANFAAIVDHLIATSGLGDATHVLLTGGSAGSIGAYFNVDWLADRLGSDVTVKGVPNAGWFNPGSLSDNDLDEIFAPSDYDRFTAGEKGNLFWDSIQLLNGTIAPDTRKLKEGVLNKDCLAYYAPNEWWACASVHIAYRYIESPLFNIHSQYDSNQIFSTQGLAPENPNQSEIESVEKYIEMWGKATRESLQQILNNETMTPKAYPGDGLFSTSCLSHGTFGTTIDGLTWLPIVRDWFFNLGEMTPYYRLMESCDDVEEGGIELPCNEASHCKYEPVTPVMKCAMKMFELECVESYGEKEECISCAKGNKWKLGKAGCDKKIVTDICNYAESNEIGN